MTETGAARTGYRRGPWTLPNFITLLRLAALPFFLYAISQGRIGIAMVLFVAAGLSDGIDGYLARRFDMKSALGAYLDPIADKLLLMSSYLFLSIPSYPAPVKIPVWLAFMVISRDVLLLTVALLLILTGSKRRFPPTWLGKVTTVTLIITVLFVLCENLWSWPRPIVLIAFGAAATAAILSGFDYIYGVASASAAERTGEWIEP
ncbi:MAG: CDP-alcohol phosphatidyltransferase family protein [Acidobacteriota bacterium]